MLEKRCQTQGCMKTMGVQLYFQGNLGSYKMKNVMIWDFLPQHTKYSTAVMWFQTCRSRTEKNMQRDKPEMEPPRLEYMTGLSKRNSLKCATEENHINPQELVRINSAIVRFPFCQSTWQHSTHVQLTLYRARRLDKTEHSIPKTQFVAVSSIHSIIATQKSEVLKPIR